MGSCSDKVLQDMIESGSTPLEPTYSSCIRLQMGAGNVGRAEELVRVVMRGMVPRLRTCSPLLLWYCQQNQVHQAVELATVMKRQHQVLCSENELVPLLRAVYATGQENEFADTVLALSFAT